MWIITIRLKGRKILIFQMHSIRKVLLNRHHTTLDINLTIINLQAKPGCTSPPKKNSQISKLNTVLSTHLGQAQTIVQGLILKFWRI
jgi:hypothetical protein